MELELPPLTGITTWRRERSMVDLHDAYYEESYQCLAHLSEHHLEGAMGSELGLLLTSFHGHS